VVSLAVEKPAAQVFELSQTLRGSGDETVVKAE